MFNRPPVPSLYASNIIWPLQTFLNKYVFQTTTRQVTASITLAYNIQESVNVSVTTSYNIGNPISSQIRQTSQDRMDFAY